MAGKRKRLFVTLLIIAVTAFIFYNSVKDSADSAEASNFFLALLEPITKAIDKVIAGADWNFIIRKGAHLTEFCVLGILVAQRAYMVGNNKSGYGGLYVLGVAVTDEYIQSFSDRTSSVTDVIIDFSGALIGFGIAFLAHQIKRCRKERKRK